MIGNEKYLNIDTTTDPINMRQVIETLSSKKEKGQELWGDKTKNPKTISIAKGKRFSCVTFVISHPMLQLNFSTWKEL